jgi:hypothetical protein
MRVRTVAGFVGLLIVSALLLPAEAQAQSRPMLAEDGQWYFAIDYDEGTGTDRKLLDVAYDGPRAWFAYAW